MDAARLLRVARAHAGLTQRELAARAGVPQPTIAAIETGAQDPRYRTLERLIRASGQELEVLPAAGVGVDQTQLPTTLRPAPARRVPRTARGAKALCHH